MLDVASPIEQERRWNGMSRTDGFSWFGHTRLWKRRREENGANGGSADKRSRPVSGENRWERAREV